MKQEFYRVLSVLLIINVLTVVPVGFFSVSLNLFELNSFIPVSVSINNC